MMNINANQTFDLCTLRTACSALAGKYDFKSKPCFCSILSMFGVHNALKPICGRQGHMHSSVLLLGMEMSPLAPKARLRPSELELVCVCR